MGDLPQKLRIPIKEGPSKGSFVSEADEKKMKRDYYNVRGWNKEGVPTKETLDRLNLTF
jgi:aldehyde:ferredoxin oxidoreductase